MNTQRRQQLIIAGRLATVTTLLFAAYVGIVALPVAAQATGLPVAVDPSTGTVPLIALGSALTAMTGLVGFSLRMLIKGDLVARDTVAREAALIKMIEDGQAVSTQLVEMVKDDRRREDELWKYVQDGTRPERRP